MPPKNSNQKAFSIASNPFNLLASDIENKEGAIDKKSKTTLHQKIDMTWKLLIASRQKCRALQYQFWASVLIEKEGLEKDDGGLDELIESILINPKMGDHHIAKLPPQYRDKMSLCVYKIFLEEKSIKGNIDKYLIFLSNWHKNLKEEIQKQLAGKNYITKDLRGNDIINPEYRARIKKIIENDLLAKRIRQELNLAPLSVEEKEEKFAAPKLKTGMDHYIDYLMADNEERAQESLEQAAKLGYVEDEDGSDDIKKPKAVVSEEYYFKICKNYLVEGQFKLLEKIALIGAKKGSAAAEYFLSIFYNDYDFQKVIPINLKKSLDYCKKAAAKGFAMAQCDLALDYLFEGRGVTKDINEAIRLFKKSAEQGCLEAQNNLGCIYAGGMEGTTSINYPEAIIWLKKAAEGGKTLAKFHLAKVYGETDKWEESVQLLMECADEELTEAQFLLGTFYVENVGGLGKYYVEGFKLIEEAARKNHDGALKYIKSKKDRFNKVGSLMIEENYVKYYVEFGAVEKASQLFIGGLLHREINEPDWKGVIMWLPSLCLNAQARAQIGIDRVRVDKINLEQQKLLKLHLPKSTIEDDLTSNNKTLITWPIINKEKERSIIYEVMKGQSPSPITKGPTGKTLNESVASQFK